MSQKPGTKKKRKVSVKKLVKACLVLAVVIYVAVILIEQRISLSRYDAVASEYEEKIAAAQIENQRLEDELSKAGTDEYLERIAREKLGLMKSNERVFIDITR